MLWPRPREAPVTIAILPSSLNRSRIMATSPHLAEGDGVHVVEGLVLAAHAPAEAVGRRARTAVDRPARGDHRLAAGDHQVPGRLRAAHEVEHAGVRREVEVEID